MGIFSWTVLSATCLLLPHLAFAQVRVGQLAPSLTSAEVIQGDLQPAEHGNPVLLEFWATWCGPCIENIPHINAMAKQFQHAGLRVISLTSENAATVKSFLKTHPIEGIVAQDPDQRLLQQFGAGTPTTVLIDRSNRIVRKVHPAQITPKALEDLVLDRPVQIAAIRDDMYPAQGGGAFHESESDASTIVKAVVRPSNKIGGLVPISNSAKDSTPELVKADGDSLPSLLAFTYDLRPEQLRISKYFQGGYYAVDAWVPNGQGSFLKPLLRTALQAAVGYEPRSSTREFAVSVLEGWPGKVQTAKPHSIKDEKGSFTVDGFPIQLLIAKLESTLNRPIIVDPIPSGTFRWHLEWDAAQPKSIENALRSQLGLRLRHERRSLPVLFIEPAK